MREVAAVAVGLALAFLIVDFETYVLSGQPIHHAWAHSESWDERIGCPTSTNPEPCATFWE